MANLVDILPPITTHVAVALFVLFSLLALVAIERGFRGVRVSLS